MNSHLFIYVCVYIYALQVVNQGGDLPADLEEVEEGVHATATYSSFARRVYSPPWGIEETRLFYQVVRPALLFLYIYLH